MKRRLGLALITLFLVLPPTADAGTYQVKACYAAPGLGVTHGNSSWVSEPDPGGVVAAFTSDCANSGIITRTTGDANRPAAWGVGARNAFNAPPTTRVVHLHADMLLVQSHGWAAGIVDATPAWRFCGPGCWAALDLRSARWTAVDLPLDTTRVFAQVTCGATSGCSRADQYGTIEIRNVIVTLRDDTAPEVRITGGSATSNRWQRDTEVSYTASDPTGIRVVRFYIDGTEITRSEGSCWDGSPRPCGDVRESRVVRPDASKADGRHVLTVEAEDGAGNRRSATQSVLIDRTPPQPPLNARTDGGPWRARNDFDVDWENPTQMTAPIAVAHAKFCPPAGNPSDTSRCGPEQTGKLGGTIGLSDLKAPSEGDWRLLVWLEDAAGNEDPSTAAVIDSVGLDETPPELRIARPDEEDPTRVRVIATDDVSGLASAQVEARRRGEDAWRALPTVLDAKGFSAVMDDERLPSGTYKLRARAVDRAGNERSTGSQEGSDAAARKLPLRIRTRLVVGKPMRVQARGSHGRKRYRTVLVVKPRVDFGRTIPLRGRLSTPGGNPLADTALEVSERVKLPSAGWRRMAIVKTNRSGRFRFKALRGPSRTLRFRYAGTAKIRARSTEVDLGIRARTTIKASRHRVVNGEDVTFSGELRGRQYGSVGKSLYLQVYTRGRWATFATPRANPSTGRWHEDYRFTATRGLVRYRFRAVVPREAGYPYEQGTSHAVRVTVRGL